MTKKWILLGLLAAMLLVTACIDTETTISVRKDGSGTVTEVVYFNAAVKAMMAGMMSQFGEEGETEKDITDPAQYAEKAAKMGEGVKFVSAKKVTGKDGSEGVELVYAFEDIRKLKLEAQPDNPMEGGFSMGDEEGENVEEDEDSPIRFDFTGGGKPTLTIYMPQEEPGEGDDEEAVEEDEEMDMEEAGSQAGMAMMKPFLQGFHMRIAVNLLDGAMGKTNASHVEKVHGKDGVVLLDMALGEILSNPEYAKDFEQLSKIKKMDKALEQMKDIPGLKIETEKKVEVQIK